VSFGEKPLSGIRVVAQGYVVPGRGQAVKMPAGEATSSQDGSFEMVLSPEFVQAAKSRQSWGWNLSLNAEHPEFLRALVKPSVLNTWDGLSKVAIAFKGVPSDMAAQLKAKFEELRKNPARKGARYGLEPTEWGPLQDLFDFVAEAVAEGRSARAFVQTYEKDSDPYVRALAYEALGLHGACEDDAGKPPQATDDASARLLLNWSLRDIERSKHGGHYSASAKLDDGCTRCYSRYEDAIGALLRLDRVQGLSWLAERKSVQGQSAIFTAILAEEFRHLVTSAEVEKEKGAGLVPDFDLPLRLTSDQAVLAYRAASRPALVESGRDSKPLSFAPEWFTLSEFSWSPDAKRLAGRGGYDRGKDYEIWILDFERGKASRATWSNTTDWRPAWFPDGRRLLFVRNGADGQELWTLDASTWESRKVDALKTYLDHFSLNPDGKRVAVGPREGAPYVLDLESGRKSAVVVDGPPARLPTWSPAGNRIAFVREGGLYDIGIDEATPHRLTPEDLKVHRYAWSPNGAWIGFSTFRGQDDGAFAVVKRDGTGYRQLRGFAGWPGEDTPTWSADSKRVAFGGDNNGGNRGDLWIHSVEDGAVYRLVAGSAGNAAWRPVR